MDDGVNILSLDAIMEADDVTEKTIPISEWNGSVVVKSITKRQMNQIKNDARDSQGDLNEDLFEKMVVVEGLVNPKITAADYERLLDKSYSAVSKITKAVLSQSNLDEGALKKEERTFRTEQ